MQAVASSKEITKQSGSNLALSFMCLPEQTRADMCTFYAFCRLVDDLVDQGGHDKPRCRREIGEWREEIDRCYTGNPSTGFGRELAAIIRRHLIPPIHFKEILDGVEMDLDADRYPDFKALEGYCYRVASAVGLVSINIFGCTQALSREYAVALGMAFQLTNILRDVRHDLHQYGRIYLPQDEMQAFGVTEADLQACRHTPGCDRLFRLQYFRAEHYFNKARRLIHPKDRPQLSAALVMTEVYHDLLKKIAARRFRVLDGPIKLSKWEKFRAVGRARFASRKPASTTLPPSHIAVWGGGFAGFSAALHSVLQGHQVTLVEAKPFLGGRAHSYTEARTGQRLDNGQHILMGCYHECLALVDLLGVRDKLDEQESLRLVYYSPTGRSVMQASTWPAPFHLLAALLRFKELDGAARLAVLSFGLRLRLGRKPGRGATVEQWLRSWNQPAAAIRALWEPLCLAALNEPVRTADATLFYEVVRRSLFGSRQGASILKARNGLGDLFMPEARLFLESCGSNLRTSAGVKAVRFTDRRVDAVELTDGTCLTADHHISALPWTALAALLPPDHPLTRQIGSIPSAPIIGLHFWTDRPLVHDPIVGLLDSPLQWIFDLGPATLPDGGKGYLSALVMSACYDWASKKPAELAAMAEQEIRRLVSVSGPFQVRHHVVYKSKDATFTARPEVRNLRPGTTTPWKNLLLAGDWTQTGLPATLEGAALSGRRAAAALG
jgi:squalene synthase HpnD